MPALAYIVCEARGHATLPLNEGGDWQAEARFLLASPAELYALLSTAELAGRGHPPNLSTLISADILFEDGDIEGQTQITVDEFRFLLPHASPEMVVRLRAWEAFCLALENQGQVTRLIIWFVR